MTAASALQIGTSLQRLRGVPQELIGRQREAAALRAALENHRNCFVSGAAGIGKTVILQALYACWDKTSTGMALFYCGESARRHRLTTHVLVNLFLERGRLESTYVTRRKTVGSLSGLRRLVTEERLIDLQRMMHQNLVGERIALILDHCDRPDPKVASLIEIWLERFPVVLVARDTAHLGHARWLASACEHLVLAPLGASASLRLANVVAQHAEGAVLSEKELREAVKRSAGNPGRLERLVRAATRPQYRRNGAVQWKLIEMDFRIRDIGLGFGETCGR